MNDECSERKRLYNEVVELKGNIRVFCRCRPLNSEEFANGSTSVVDFNMSRGNEIQIVSSDSSRKQFRFDHVFKPEDGQVCNLSVLDGFNVCIFAYGQTGTGKTFTMEGTPENSGVNYQTLEKLFSLSSERSSIMKYELFVSMLEVYNEKIRDLLVDNFSEPAKKLEVKQSAEGTQEVPGLIEARVYGTDEVTLRRDSLDVKEEDYYTSLYNEIRVKLNLILLEMVSPDFGLPVIYVQAVDHPYLVEYSVSALARSENAVDASNVEQPCGICHDSVEEPVAGVFPVFSGESFQNFSIVAEKLRADYDFGHTLDAKLLPHSGPVDKPTLRLLKPFDELFADFQDFQVDQLEKFIEEASIPTVTIFGKNEENALLFVNFSRDFDAFKSKYHEVASGYERKEISFLLRDTETDVGVLKCTTYQLL
nr:kinesin-like protein KIN-14S [Ipomoea trifida]